MTAAPFAFFANVDQSKGLIGGLLGFDVSDGAFRNA
jgi:hypothetical protein